MKNVVENVSGKVPAARDRMGRPAASAQRRTSFCPNVNFDVVDTGVTRLCAQKIALAIYFITGIVDLVLGTIYITSDQFLSYHAQAVGSSWQEVDFGTQTLILALMKVAGGGWLALGFLTIGLILYTLKTNSGLVRWLLPTGTVIFWLACLAATWSVYRETGAQSPWAPSLGLIGMALVALLVDAPWFSRNGGED